MQTFILGANTGEAQVAAPREMYCLLHNVILISIQWNNCFCFSNFYFHAADLMVNVLAFILTLANVKCYVDKPKANFTFSLQPLIT